MITKEEFAKKLKQKFPQYKNINNEELVSKTLEKFPSYGNKIIGFSQEPTNIQPLENSIETTEPKEEKRSLGRKIIDFFTRSEQQFGETIGQSIASVTERETIEESNKDLIESGSNLIEIAKKTEDKEKRNQLINLANESFQIAGTNMESILPALDKSTKQIVGEALGVTTDIAAFGTYGKAFKVAKGTKPAKAFVQGALRRIPEGAVIGSGFGVSESLKRDEPAEEIIKSGAKSGLLGGILSGIFGGLEARSKALAPVKAMKLREKAIEQYKRGLKATKEKFKEKGNKIIPELLDKNVWGSFKKLMKKADDGISLNKQEYKKLGELQGIIGMDDLVKSIDNKLKAMTTPSGTVLSTKKTSYNALQSLKDDILAFRVKAKMGNTEPNKLVAFAEDLRKLAQTYGDDLYQTRKSMKTISDSKTLSQVKQVDNAIRNLLNKKYPKYSEINKVYHLNTELKDILIETAKRKEGRSVISLIQSVAGAGGIGAGAALGGNIGSAAVGGFGLMALTSILKSSWWNTLRAVRKNNLANKLLQKSGKELSYALSVLVKQGIKGAEKILNE